MAHKFVLSGILRGYDDRPLVRTQVTVVPSAHSTPDPDGGVVHLGVVSATTNALGELTTVTGLPLELIAAPGLYYTFQTSVGLERSFASPEPGVTEVALEDIIPVTVPEPMREYARGRDGKSAYEVWLDAGHEGTVEDYLAWVAAGGEGAGVTAEQFLEHVNSDMPHPAYDEELPDLTLIYQNGLV